MPLGDSITIPIPTEYLIFEPSNHNFHGTGSQKFNSASSGCSVGHGWSAKKSTNACPLIAFWDTYSRQNSVNAKDHLPIFSS